MSWDLLSGTRAPTPGPTRSTCHPCFPSPVFFFHNSVMATGPEEPSRAGPRSVFPNQVFLTACFNRFLFWARELHCSNGREPFLISCTVYTVLAFAMTRPPAERL